MKTVVFYTLGCKVNQYETQALKEQFASRGYIVAPDNSVADIYVVNTCTVTNTADRKSRQLINKARKLNPDAKIAVIGCYPERDAEAIEGVDIILGNADKSTLIDKIENGEKSFEIARIEEYDDLGTITSMDTRTRAYIKIEDGCDRFCSYCAIPYARGPVRSRPLDSILLEANALLENGFKEIVLTGINAALYDGGIHTILDELEKIDKDFRVRIGSLEPTVISAEYVKRLMNYDKLCPHFHLSLQSGSDNILKAMRRRYNRQEYLDIINILKSKDPNFGLSTDIIVGFPGETDEDFQDSVDIVKEVRFEKVHVFPYSERSGTEAVKLGSKVSNEIKSKRCEELISVAERTADEFLNKNIGVTRRALLERETDGILEGLAENGIKVYCKGDNSDINKFKIGIIGEDLCLKRNMEY